jgi:hypothetical protein
MSPMTRDLPPRLSGVGQHDMEFRKEALTMALYVAICLMASLIVIPERQRLGTEELACRPGTVLA